MSTRGLVERTRGLRRHTCLILVLLAWADAPRAADLKCTDVTPDPDSPDSYKSRGTRCEGFYLRRFAASVVPQSLTLGDILLADNGGTATVRWDVQPKGEQLDLVVRNAMCSPNYQMRAGVAADAGSFSWPTSIPVKHAVRSLGVQATTARGDYLPARANAANETGEYRIVFCSSEPLVKVWIKVYDSADGEVSSTHLKRTNAGSISVGIPSSKLTAHGKYRVSFTAGAVNAGFTFELP